MANERRFFLEAEAEEYGIEIECTNVPLLIGRLTKLRKQLGLSDQFLITASRLDPNNKVWIVNRAKETGTTDREENAEPVCR